MEIRQCIYSSWRTIAGRLPDALKSWRETSWLLGGTVTGERLKTLAFVLHAIAGIAIGARPTSALVREVEKHDERGGEDEANANR